ncbi:hypothetical protein LWI29_027727 [Acer saccharum]|uniref:Uncharacterized protein n=1 Tax=Acer saccharum TaxID=4024 RepID=A0AA39RTB3_ACESA|nr:hypothetical protein LWI29_027727 [Acer saccharum]
MWMIIMHMNQQMRLSLILLLSLVTFSCFGQVTFAQLQRLHQNEADALRQIATTLGATLVDSTDDPCQSGKLSISTANSSTIVNSIASNALRQIATTLGATLVNSTDDPCQSGKLSIATGTANTSTIFNNITCNYTDGVFSHVTSFSVTGTGISGEIPKEWGYFANLTYFAISDNNFSGTVPEFIGRWPKLRRLEMYSSGLEGPISPTIFALGNLTNL